MLIKKLASIRERVKETLEKCREKGQTPPRL